MFCDALPPPSYLSPNSFSRFASLCFISFYSSGFSSFSFRVPHLFIIISKVLLNPSFAEMIFFFWVNFRYFFFGQFFSFYFVSFPKEGGNAIIITTTKLISKTLLLIFVSLSLSYDNFYLFFFFQFVHNPTTTNTCINDISYIQDLREREISKSKLFFFFFLTLI